MDVDYGKTAADYGRHRRGFPDELYRRLRPFDVGLAGQTIVDLGAGTGFLGRGFAKAGCPVTCVDISEAMMAESARLDSICGVQMTYHRAPAETTGLPDHAFDVVSAGQCWHWFDRPAAAREARRLVRPGGAVVLAHYDWLPLPGNVVVTTEGLIQSHSPSWTHHGGNGFYPEWPQDLIRAGFLSIETFSFDTIESYSHADWRGRVRACGAISGSPTSDRVRAADEELARTLAERHPEDPLPVPHRVFAVVARAPTGC